MATTPVEPGTAAPAPKTNRIGLTVIEYKGGKTTLCAGCGHNAISERIIEAMYEMGVQPELRHQAQRHRLLLEDSRVFHEPLAQLQRRARTHALRRHRRPARQSQTGLHRRQRRWRHRLHRHRPVHSPHAPQSADHLHHRRQRRLRPHQRPVLRHRRSRLEAEIRRHQRSSSHRYLRASPSNSAQPWSVARSPATSASSAPC